MESFGFKDEGTDLEHKNNYDIPSNGRNKIGFALKMSLTLKNNIIYGLFLGIVIRAKIVTPMTRRLSLNLEHWFGKS